MPSECLYKDCMNRDIDAVPGNLDIYCSGFPCQPFSSAGNQLAGLDLRGQLCLACLQVIFVKQPNSFLLENVKGLLDCIEEFTYIVDFVRALVDEEGEPLYEVHWEVMESTTHGGVPQHRERLFIIGLKRKAIRMPFFWPTPVSKIKTLEDVLENKVGAASLIDSLSNTKRKNLIAVMEKAQGMQGDIIAELGASYRKMMVDVCPCLTATRSGDEAYWSVRRHRPLNMNELMLLQGMQPSWLEGWEEVVSHRQMGKIVGNAMTITVMQRLLAKIFFSLGWAVKPDEFE
jgi:DNA-cytosine methyltransferase